jgi:hypothetical protein
VSLSATGRLPSVPDGPFPWNDDIEALINLIIAVGAMLGTLLTLLVYDYLNGRVDLIKIHVKTHLQNGTEHDGSNIYRYSDII